MIRLNSKILQISRILKTPLLFREGTRMIETLNWAIQGKSWARTNTRIQELKEMMRTRWPKKLLISIFLTASSKMSSRVKKFIKKKFQMIRAPTNLSRVPLSRFSNHLTGWIEMPKRRMTRTKRLKKPRFSWNHLIKLFLIESLH